MEDQKVVADRGHDAGRGGGDGERLRRGRWGAEEEEDIGAAEDRDQAHESSAARYVCFSKRHKGLFKRAVKLATRCGAHVAVVVFSCAGKPYSIGYPSVNAVVDRYLDPASASAAAPCAAAVAEETMGRLATILRDYEAEKERLEEAMKAEVSRRKALERVQAEAQAAWCVHEEVMLQQCAAVGAGDHAFHDPTAGAFTADSGAGSSYPDPGAMDAQTTMLMGGDVNHAPMHFASMMLPPFNYGSDHNQFAGNGGYDLGDSSGHDAANEMEGCFGYASV